MTPFELLKPLVSMVSFETKVMTELQYKLRIKINPPLRQQCQK